MQYLVVPFMIDRESLKLQLNESEAECASGKHC